MIKPRLPKRHLTDDNKVAYCGKWWQPYFMNDRELCLRCDAVDQGRYRTSVAKGPNPLAEATDHLAEVTNI